MPGHSLATLTAPETTGWHEVPWPLPPQGRDRGGGELYSISKLFSIEQRPMLGEVPKDMKAQEEFWGQEFEDAVEQM